MKTTTALLAAAVLLSAVPAMADGILGQLPPEGSWAEFEVAGEGIDASGKVSVTLKGTLKLSSVGREMRDGEACRWIELETAIEIERGDKKGEQTETLKLLIPEQFLARGQNPAAHALAAWKQTGQGAARELDLQGDDARELASMDELFHESLNLQETRQGVEYAAPAGKFLCKQVHAKQVPEDRAAPVEFSTQTWLSDKVPFGVVAYRYDKMRSQGGVSLGGRWMECKLAKTGKDAKSKIAK